MQTFEQEIVRETNAGAMPPLPYRVMHWQAALQPSDREALAALAAVQTIETGSIAVGDAARGRGLFDRRCSGCHALDSEREGPRLRGVYGRRAGSVPGFQYSRSIRSSGVTWNDVTLDRWLSDSDAMLPGSAMGMSVPKLRDRADLIAFLRSLR